MSQCCCFTIPWTLKVSLSLFFTLLNTDADTVIATSWCLKSRAIRLFVQRSFPIPITWYLCIEPVLWICLLDIFITHWGRVTHICVSKLTIISSDNGLSPGRRQAIIWTNAEILATRTSGTNFNEILNEIHTFSFKKLRLKISSPNWRQFCPGLNV